MNAWQRAVWVVTLGPLFALPWLLFAGLAAATVVALPWAKSAVQIAMWAAWPTAEVPTSTWEPGSNQQDPERQPATAGYVAWVAVAGLWLAVLHHIIAALFALTIIGIFALFPHLELGRAALTLNPGSFRMGPRGDRRLGLPLPRPSPSMAEPSKERLHFP